MRPQIRHATRARAPRTIAPPTPPTTPPMTFFELSLRLEPPPPFPPFKFGVEVTTALPVVTASTALEVAVEVKALPPLVPTIVVTT